MPDTEPKPNSYLERYLAGERVEVWDELIALGEAVRTPPLLDEALAVSREIVRRAKYNLGLLHQRLLDLGYQFAEPAEAFRLAEPEDVELFDEVERKMGILPLFVRVWYESIASVGFRQERTQRYGPTESELGGLGQYSDLVVQSLRAVQEEYARKPSRFFPTGAVASNCERKGFWTPCLGIDDIVCNEGDGEVYLVQELRKLFLCGGFPMYGALPLDTPDLKPHPWDTQPRPNWRRIMPLLKEGLLEL